MSTETVTAGFQIHGEFITDHARELWEERSFAKALDLLECMIGMTKDQHEGVLFGKMKLTGINEINLEEDDWTPPEHYCPSIKQALTEGQHFPEMQRRREDEAWDYARMEWSKTRGDKYASIAYWSRMCSLVGEPRAKEIYDAVMHENADAQSERYDQRHNRLDGMGLQGVAAMARNQMAMALGGDESLLPSVDALLNRGNEIVPRLDPKMESVNGWLLPDGKFYGCGTMEHVGLAAALLPDAENGENEAEKRGWIKLCRSITGFHCLCQKRPTKKQFDRLFDYAQRHGRDYEQMISMLPE